MILGDRCTRGCRFCNVDKKHVNPPEYDEPERVAAALRETGLREVVLTSVTRDDLPDGGAAHWAHTIRAVRNTLPDVLIEVLIPDFGGNSDALELVIAEHPDVMGHNLETVPRLYPSVRPEAGFERSLHVLRQSHAAGLITKTSLMLGLGETMDEIRAVLQAARRTGCQIFYAGQYLQPSTRHTPVVRYLTPAEFDEIGAIAKALGFGFVSSAPLVRSSYHEDGQSEFVRQLKCKKSFA